MAVLEPRPSFQLSGRRKQIPVNLRAALSTQSVPEQPGLHSREILWREWGSMGGVTQITRRTKRNTPGFTFTFDRDKDEAD